MTLQERTNWVDDLRSGDYQQTTGCLKDDTGFCCIGVYLDRKDNTAWHDGGYWENTSPTHVPEIFTNSLADDSSVKYDIKAKLTSMNDTEGKSFLEIADWVEKNIIPTDD